MRERIGVMRGLGFSTARWVFFFMFVEEELKTRPKKASLYTFGIDGRCMKEFTSCEIVFIELFSLNVRQRLT